MALPDSLLIACAWLVTPAQSPAHFERIAATRPERSVDGPSRANPRPTQLSPAVRVARGPFVSVQVNVDSGGANILGDAANEPSIAVDPRDPTRMAIGWRQFDDVASDFRQAGWGYSRNGGKSWSFPGVLEPGVFRSDPVLESDAFGTFYFNSLTFDGVRYTCDLFRSLDGGMSWDRKVHALGGDKAWMAIDRTRGIGGGNLYCAWDFEGCCGLDTFNRSVDHGASFETPVAIPNVPSFGTVAVGPEGEVYVAGVDRSFQIWVARSTNARDRFVQPSFDLVKHVVLGGSFPITNEPNPGGLAGQVWIAVDPSSGPRRGWVYLLCSLDPSNADPCDVRFARSTDHGATWSTPIKINADAPGARRWQWFGTLGCSPDGRLDVVWNDTSHSDQANLCELYYSCSFDGGTKWLPGIPVSPPWDSHAGWPANQGKIGDYYDIHSDAHAAHVAYSATFNGEQDVYYLRIGDF